MGQYLSSSRASSITQVETIPLTVQPAKDSLDTLDLSTVVENMPPNSDDSGSTIPGFGSPSTSVDCVKHLSPADTLTSMGPASRLRTEIMPECNGVAPSKLALSSAGTRKPTFDEMDQSLRIAQPFGHQHAERFSVAELDSQYVASRAPEQPYVPQLKFNLDGLVQIVMETLKVQQQQPDIELLGFGCFNKVFLISFKDARDLVVRIPYLKPRYDQKKQIESEVATMKYAKSKLPVKWATLIPSVVAYDSDPANIVGQPYIIMERAEGRELTDIWDDLDMSQKRQIVQQTAELTSALHLIGNEFTDIGSLCNENDEFLVGPFYSGYMSINQEFQGPWPTTPKSLMAQLNSTLLRWQARRFPQTTEKHHCSGVPISSILEVYSHLTELVTKFEPCKVTGDPNADYPRSLVHPDLNLGNIFVDPKSLRLSGIIDWADAGIHPEWYYTAYPSYLRGPDVYCKDSPMSGFALPEYWERWRDLTYLRHYYLGEKGSMEPGFRYRLDKYAVLHQLKRALLVDFAMFDNDDLGAWVEEQVSEFRTGAAKVEHHP